MSSRRLVPVAVPAGPAALEFLPALRAALSGDGPALLPHPDDVPPPAALAPGEPLADGEDDPHDPTVAVVATSGSSGRPKGALLPASALLASVSATHDRLGGPGRWLLALPAGHVAGLQVLLRSLVARTEPVVMDLTGGFRAEAFVAAASAMTAGRVVTVGAAASGVRRYTSLVPTQLHRLLEAGDGAISALAGFDAVLLGGAAAPAPLLARAAEHGVRVVRTYGMSETCGGCVYDGRPLDGVRVEVDGDGRVRLGGPVVARGYRGGDPDGAFSTDATGTRWFRTDDAGRLDLTLADGAGAPGPGRPDGPDGPGAPDGPDGPGAPDGPLLTVLGRIDDVIVTGGLKISPAVVEAALLGLPAVAEAVVVGVPDDEWGGLVVAAVVLADGAAEPALEEVRREVTRRAGSQAAPRRLLVLDRLPLRGPGKPDRARIAELARQAAAAPRTAAPTGAPTAAPG